VAMVSVRAMVRARASARVRAVLVEALPRGRTSVYR